MVLEQRVSDEQWQAINESDQTYDTIFYYGVTSTKIFLSTLVILERQNGKTFAYSHAQQLQKKLVLDLANVVNPTYPNDQNRP